MLRKKKRNPQPNMKIKKLMIRRRLQSPRKAGMMNLGDQAAIKKIKESNKTSDLPRKSLKRHRKLLF